MANAPFQIHFLSLYRRGGCFWGHVVLSQHVSMPRPMRRLAQAFHSATSLAISSERAAARLDIGLVIARPLSLVRWSWSRRWVGFLVGVRCYCSLCSLGAACRWFACLLCAVLRFCLVLSCYNEAPLLVRVSGTGGIRWSLLVGGLGPVLSIPKLCFKPFRTYQPTHGFNHGFLGGAYPYGRNKKGGGPRFRRPCPRSVS